MINTEKLNEFKTLLESTSLERCDRDNFLFLLDYLSGKHIQKLSSRSFLIYGEPGVGKTYIVEKLINVIDLPVIFAGYTPIKHEKLIYCSNLEEVVKAMADHKKCIIFLDDLEYVFNKDGCGEVESEDKRCFMKILENTKDSNSVLIATINNRCSLDASTFDRIDVHIEVDLPTEANRLHFFKNEFPEYIDKKDIKFLSKATVGYNYRDIPELVKMAYRFGKGKISASMLKEALKLYTPSSLAGYRMIRNTGINFNNVIGKEHEKNVLKKMFRIMKNRTMAKRLGIKRANFMIFCGSPGTGKTYMAKALSGEISWPMVSINAFNIHNGDALRSIRRIMNLARRFKNCIIFIDEAEKLLAREFFGDDTPLQGAFQSELDGIDIPIDSLVILAMNDVERFGEPIKDRFNVLEFDFPSKEDRLEFFRQKLKKTGKHLHFNADIESLVSMTENMSFRVMEKTWNEAAFHFMDTKEPITEELFARFIKRVSRRDELRHNRYENAMFG